MLLTQSLPGPQSAFTIHELNSQVPPVHVNGVIQLGLELQKPPAYPKQSLVKPPGAVAHT